MAVIYGVNVRNLSSLLFAIQVNIDPTVVIVIMLSIQIGAVPINLTEEDWRQDMLTVYRKFVGLSPDQICHQLVTYLWLFIKEAKVHSLISLL